MWRCAIPDSITVVAAPAFATIQDLGRTGFRDSGVPVSGVADRDSALTLNAILGNEPNAAMIECAVTGGVFRCAGAATVAIGGASAAVSVNGVDVDAWTALVLADGDELRVEQITGGRFVLVAVRGGIDVPVVLGSRSTLVSAAIGGLEGRRLRNGDRLQVGPCVGTTRTEGGLGRSDGNEGPIIVMRGPQASLFGDAAWDVFLNSQFVVSRASDRTGYRLDGASFAHDGAASIPSEPACVGAIQIPDGGTPIVIMHDGPTVGGYPKIAVIRSECLSRFAQMAPGDRVRFAVA